MDKQAIECLINSSKKDSLISNLSIQIINLNDRIKGKEVILGDNRKSIKELEDENKKINLHLTQSRRNVKIFGTTGILVGIATTLFLQK